MCNLSDLIEEKGIEKGIEKGQVKMLERLISSGKITLEEAAEEMQISVAEMEALLKNNECNLV